MGRKKEAADSLSKALFVRRKPHRRSARLSNSRRRKGEGKVTGGASLSGRFASFRFVSFPFFSFFRVFCFFLKSPSEREREREREREKLCVGEEVIRKLKLQCRQRE